jgi:hypothetical protein
MQTKKPRICGKRSVLEELCNEVKKREEVSPWGANEKDCNNLRDRVYYYNFKILDFNNNLWQSIFRLKVVLRYRR